MKTLAICICAYDCAEFIPDLVNSLFEQKPYEGWKYDIRIGVDGCEKTSQRLQALLVPHLWSSKNYGHAIMRNSLIYYKPAHAYAYFDADDVMYPEYCRENAKATSIYFTMGIVMAKKINCDINLNPKGKAVIENGGAMTFTHLLLRHVGGFQPYRCAIDTDLMRRAEMAGFRIHVIDKPLYLRRSHPKALTKAKDTKIGSTYRKQVWNEMCNQRKKGVIKIKPVVVPLEER
jgi:glycosyltransferase involved in cell wall biosynthesis